MSVRLGLLLAAVALALTAAGSAIAAEKLAIPAARERAAAFAERTCEHDESCAKAGVQSCRRLDDRIVLCRIYDHRKTEDQGNFLCTRLIRLQLDPATRRIPVTGVSDWDC
jgi:hypothetical protein